MKTEPTEALKMLSETQLNPIHEIPRYKADIIARIAFTEGQSSPKIKQLEWVEVWDDNGDSKTPFGHYITRYGKIYGKMMFEMVNTRKEKKYYHTIDEAKAAAQDDFERRVMECIDIEPKK